MSILIYIGNVQFFFKDFMPTKDGCDESEERSRPSRYVVLGKFFKELEFLFLLSCLFLLQLCHNSQQQYTVDENRTKCEAYEKTRLKSFERRLDGSFHKSRSGCKFFKNSDEKFIINKQIFRAKDITGDWIQKQ